MFIPVTPAVYVSTNTRIGLFQFDNFIRRCVNHECALTVFLAFHGIFHLRSRTKSCLLYCMHWLQHSTDGVVNNRLPVKKLFC